MGRRSLSRWNTSWGICWGLPLALLAIAAGCDGEPPVEVDGGNDAGVDGAMPSEGPEAPAPPGLPDFGPCPDGWRAEDSGEGFDVCEPFPVGGRPACGRDEAFFPGAAACSPIGTACPAGNFPEDLPGGATALYVLAGVVAGDGTEASPFATIGEALAVAGAGDVIAVGKGRYSEAITIPGGVTVVGACVAETVLTSDASSYTAGVINIGGLDAAIRNLRIADAARPAVMVVGEGKSLDIQDVVLHDCAIGGISVEAGAALTAERVVARNFSSLEAVSALGRGLNVEADSQATVRWLHVEGAKEFGVLVMGGASLTLEDATLVDTQLPSETGRTGTGLGAAEGGTLVARRVVVDEATMIGVLLQNADTDATAEDLVVRRTRPGIAFGGARGIDATQFASFQCARCLVEDVLETGIGSLDESAMVLTDTLVRRVGPRAGDQRAGRAISVQNGGGLEFRRIAAVDLREQGVVAHGDGTILTGEDLVVRRVLGEVYTGEYGRGLSFEAGAVGDLARIEIGHVTESAIFSADRGVANLTDVYIHDVSGRIADGRFGRGVTVQREAEASLTRARIERVREFGIGGAGAGARLTATDLSVSEITPQDCSAGLCSDEPGGHGIGSYFSAQVSVQDFGVDAASLCGVQVAVDANLVLGDGVVRGALIGACLQSDSQDIADLQDGVRYIDNGSNFEATMLPVPGAIEATE